MKIVFKVLLVILITAVIINLLIAIKPFSSGETAEDGRDQELEKLIPEDMENIPDADGGSEGDEGGTPPEDKDIIGYANREAAPAGDDKDMPENGSAKENRKYFLTYEEIVSIKDIDFRDKLFGMAMLRKVDNADLQKMLRIADGGITGEEWQAIGSILKKYLSGEDIEKIKEIINKNKKLYEEGKLANR